MKPLGPEFYLNETQIENILNRLVPLIAAPGEEEFVRTVLRLKAEHCTAARFAYFVSQIFKAQREEA